MPCTGPQAKFSAVPVITRGVQEIFQVYDVGLFVLEQALPSPPPPSFLIRKVLLF
jgi:hypothetical protein